MAWCFCPMLGMHRLVCCTAEVNPQGMISADNWLLRSWNISIWMQQTSDDHPYVIHSSNHSWSSWSLWTVIITSLVLKCSPSIRHHWIPLARILSQPRAGVWRQTQDLSRNWQHGDPERPQFPQWWSGTFGDILRRAMGWPPRCSQWHGLLGYNVATWWT